MGGIAHVVDISGTRRTRVNSIRASDIHMDQRPRYGRGVRIRRTSHQPRGVYQRHHNRAGWSTAADALSECAGQRGRFQQCSTTIPDRNNSDRNDPDRANNGGNRTATYLVGKLCRQRPAAAWEDTTPSNSMAAWGDSGFGWRINGRRVEMYTGSGAARSRSADSATAGALYNLANRGQPKRHSARHVQDR